MAKFKPSHDVLDKENDNKLLKAGQEVEMTVKRAEELQTNIRKQAKENSIRETYKDFKMERIEDDKETKDEDD